MKTTLKFLTYVMMAFALVFTSCDGEDGMDGAEGPQGEQGISGQDGMDGQDGVDGEDGNANVIASPWTPTEFSTTASTLTFFDIEDPQITPEIADGAAFYAYGRSGAAVLSIPLVFSNRSYYFGVFPDDNNFRFIAASVDGATPFIFGDVLEVRYVIIPQASRMSIDYTNYEEVKRAYNLKD